jgi:hypothetical protein
MIKEESGISAGVAPLNSVGTGIETSLPPAVEPPGRPKGMGLTRRKPKKKKIYESSMTYAFMVTLPSLGDVVVYARNETMLKNVLRKYIRDTDQIINIKRLMPAQIIDFYTNKKNNAVKRIKDVVVEGTTMNGTAIPSPAPLANPQQEKAAQAKNTQGAKQDASKRIALAKQNAQRQLQQKKIEMQKNLANQQKTLQQKAKSGTLNSTPAV